MKFVRIGEHALDLETCVFTQTRTESTDVKGIHVQSSVASFTAWENREPQDYADLRAYVMALPTLATINQEREMQIRREALNANYDPFTDISSLFNAFNTLPNREELRLVLDDFEHGHIWHMVDKSVVVEWSDFRMGLDAIERYSQKLASPVEQ